MNSFFCFVLFELESTQLEDPRQEWKSIQEQMLREYLTSAQDVLVAKKEIYDVKNRRLRLAEDEYNMLTAMAASRNSCKYLFAQKKAQTNKIKRDEKKRKTLLRTILNGFLICFFFLLCLHKQCIHQIVQ